MGQVLLLMLNFKRLFHVSFCGRWGPNSEMSAIQPATGWGSLGEGAFVHLAWIPWSLSYLALDLGVSRNGGTPIWLVYKEKNQLKRMMTRGSPMTMETPIWINVFFWPHELIGCLGKNMWFTWAEEVDTKWHEEYRISKVFVGSLVL